jgi:hypothetical protein
MLLRIVREMNGFEEFRIAGVVCGISLPDGKPILRPWNRPLLRTFDEVLDDIGDHRSTGYLAVLEKWKAVLQETPLPDDL